MAHCVLITFLDWVEMVLAMILATQKTQIKASQNEKKIDIQSSLRMTSQLTSFCLRKIQEFDDDNRNFLPLQMIIHRCHNQLPHAGLGTSLFYFVKSALSSFR